MLLGLVEAPPFRFSHEAHITLHGQPSLLSKTSVSKEMLDSSPSTYLGLYGFEDRRVHQGDLALKHQEIQNEVNVASSAFQACCNVSFPRGPLAALSNAACSDQHCATCLQAGAQGTFNLHDPHIYPP